MKHLQGIAGSLVIAILCVMFVSTASSQIDIRVNPEHRTRHHIVHHRQSRVRVNAPENRRVVRHQDEHHDHDRQPEHHDNR